MNVINDETKLTTSECEKRTGLTAREIAKLCKKALIKGEKNGGKWIVDIENLKQYILEHPEVLKKPKPPKTLNSVFGDIELKPDEVMKPCTSFNYDYDIFDIYRHEYTQQYFISNYGNVYSVEYRGYLKPDIKHKSDTYDGLYYVNGYHRIEKRYEHLYIHRLVAYFFCDNRLSKKEVHHIDFNSLNNDYKNLIWVTDAEHKKCNKLFYTDKKAYRKYITQLRRENKCTSKMVKKDKNNPFLYV